MFPINWNDAFRKKDGTLGTMEDSGGSGGGSFTPDYENEVLEIGVHNNFNYYIPMSKEYIGEHLEGYEIKTIDNTGYTATVEVYKIIVVDGEVVYSVKLKTIVYNSGAGYDDDDITVIYDGSWKATLKVPMKNVSDDEPVTSPVTWAYSTEVDYKWYISE